MPLFKGNKIDILKIKIDALEGEIKDLARRRDTLRETALSKTRDRDSLVGELREQVKAIKNL